VILLKQSNIWLELEESISNNNILIELSCTESESGKGALRTCAVGLTTACVTLAYASPLNEFAGDHYRLMVYCSMVSTTN